MTVEMGGECLFRQWEAKLGPDPLREDADAEVGGWVGGAAGHPILLAVQQDGGRRGSC